VILGTRWSADTWPAAKAVLGWALAERGRLRRVGWFKLMTVDDAKQAILERICPDWRRVGEGASWDRIALQQELDIPPSIFSRAIVELVADGFLAFMAERPTDVRLADAGVALCESPDQSGE
jgi:hypothetical protein